MTAPGSDGRAGDGTADPRTVDPRTGLSSAGVSSAGDRVIVCGFGGLGARIVELLGDAGLRVTVVDPSGARTRPSGTATVIEADATAPGVLESAGLADCVALICVEDGELRNLRIALLAREHRPGLRVVTALRNAAVGRALSGADGAGGDGAGGDGPGGDGPGGDEHAGADTVLDVAGLATPTVVEACLESPVHELDVAGHRFLAASTHAPRPSTLRALYGDLVPLAVSHVDPGAPGVVVCPGRDQTVGTHDHVTLLGTPDELATAGVATAPPEPADRRVTRRGGGRDPDQARPRRRRGRRVVATLAQIVRDSERGMAWALGALVALIAVSTVVLRVGYTDPGMSVLDALYFTVEAVATVGFGDYSFAHQPVWLRLWAVFLMLAGVAATAIPIAFFTDTLVSRRLSATAGRRRASGAEGHVVLVGLGAVGVSVLAALRSRGRDVVVLERDLENRYLDTARALGAPVVFGDATSAEVLTAARVPRAAAVAVLTSDDMANIETGLAVRAALGARWAQAPVVLRVADRELARTVGRRFGFRNVHSVVELAAPRFVGAALGLDVLGSFPVHRQTFLLGRLTVGENSGLDGLAMRELSSRTRVVALRRHGPTPGAGPLEHPPRRDTRFAAGDEAFVLGPYPELLDLLRRQRAPQETPAPTPGLP